MPATYHAINDDSALPRKAASHSVAWQNIQRGDADNAVNACPGGSRVPACAGRS